MIKKLNINTKKKLNYINKNWKNQKKEIKLHFVNKY